MADPGVIEVGMYSPSKGKEQGIFVHNNVIHYAASLLQDVNELIVWELREGLAHNKDSVSIVIFLYCLVLSFYAKHFTCIL